MKNKKLILISVFLFSIFSVFALAATELSVYPAEKDATYNEEFIISINIDTTESVILAQIDVNFDPNVIEALSIADGGFFSKDNDSLYGMDVFSQIKNTEGVVELVLIKNNDTIGVTGSGSLANITFKAIAKNGITSLELDNIIVADSYAIPITTSVNNPGTVTVKTIYPIVINEIMQNPSGLEPAGQWFELYNPNGYDVDIDGWTIKDLGSDNHVINNGGPLIIAAGDYLVLCRNDNTLENGGVECDYGYSSFSLGNSDDEVILLNEGLFEIDRVEYDGGVTFPNPIGASMELISPSLDNSVGLNWREATVPFGDGDYGTPGSQNVLLTGPEITNLVRYPEIVYNDDDVILNATITDVVAMDFVAVYSNFEGIFKSYEVVDKTGDVYSFVINNSYLENQEEVTYSWIAQDIAGHIIEVITHFIVQNREPTSITIPPLYLNEGGWGEINLNNYFEDPDNDELFYTSTQPTNIEVIINQDINIAVLFPDEDFSGTDHVVFTAEDPYGGINSSNEVSLTVNPVNDAPTISGIPNQVVPEDSDVILNVAPYINDVDNDISELIITENSAYATVNGHNITFNYPDSVLEEIVTITVSDGMLTDEQDIIVIVTQVNDLPVINIISPIIFDEDGYNDDIDLDDYVEDEEDADEDISWSATDTTNLVVNINNEHILNVSANENWFGTKNITLTATDSDEGSSSIDVTVTVNPINDAPYFTSTPDLTAIGTTQYSYDADANDVDNDINTLEFSIITAPAGATINPDTGLFTWTPTLAQVGLNEIELKVQDTTDFGTQKFNLTVSSVLDMIDIEINGESVEDAIISDLAPGDFINLNFDLINKFPAEPNKAIVGIDVEGAIAAFGLSQSTSGIILEGQETQTINYQYQIPYSASEASFNLVISAEGEDLYENPHAATKTINFNIDRDFHRIEVANKVFSKDKLTCDRSTSLIITLANTGNWSEEGTVTVYNANTKTNEKKSFNLNVAEEEDIVFNIDASEASNNEEFAITVKYRSVYYIIEDSINLMINGCLDIESLNAILKVDESEAPAWSVNLNDYKYGDDVVTYAIVGENLELIDCTVTLAGIFTCGAPINDFVGISVINMSVGDVYEQFNVEVVPVNDPPIAYDVATTLDEDTTVVINFNCSDIEGDSLTYVVVSDPGHGILSGSGNSRTYTPDADYNGNDLFTYKCNDGTSDSNIADVNIIINSILDEPSITSVSPDYNPLVGDGIKQEFSVTIADPDGVGPVISWYVDDDLKQSGTSTIFSYSAMDDYTLKVNITYATDNNEHEWDVDVSTLPVTTYDGTIHDVDGTNVDNFTGLTIENSYVKIDFGNQIIDLSDVVDIDRYVRLENGIVGINSDVAGFDVFKNHAATITMYGVDLIEPVKIYYNSGFSATGTTECPGSICSNIDYNSETKTLTFDVARFSIFFIGNRAPLANAGPDQTIFTGELVTLDGSASSDPDDDTIIYSWQQVSGPSVTLSDSVTAKPTFTVPEAAEYVFSLIVNDGQADSQPDNVKITAYDNELDIISVKLNSEDNDEELKPGEDLTVKVKVKNKGDDDIENIELRIWFEDENGNKLEDDDGDEIEEDEEFDLDEGDSETITFEFTNMPMDVEDGDKYTVHVEAEGENAEDSSIIYLDIDESETIEFVREKHELELKSTLIPGSIKCSRRIAVDVSIRNIGKKEEDVTLTVSNSELGIDERETFVLSEDLDDDDSKEELSYNFFIGEDVGAGVYPIKVKAEYSKTETEILNLEVMDCEKVVEEKEEVLVEKEEEKKEVVAEKEEIKEQITTISFRDTSTYIVLLATTFILMTGLVILFIGSMIISFRKK